MDDLTYKLLGVFFKTKRTDAHNEINFSHGMGVEFYGIKYQDKLDCRDKLIETKLIKVDQTIGPVAMDYKITLLGRIKYMTEAFKRLTKTIGVWIPILAAAISCVVAVLTYRQKATDKQHDIETERRLTTQESINKLHSAELKTLFLFRDSVRQAEKAGKSIQESK